jgi:hypothetical protein
LTKRSALLCHSTLAQNEQSQVMTPNWLAYAALLTWPLVALWLYLSRPVNQATLWTILGAQLLLPVGAAIKFEGVPQFDKVSIPNLAAFIGCLLVVRRSPQIWTGSRLAGLLILMYLVGPFITAELNSDPVVLPTRTLPSETHYDALSAVVTQILYLLPFFLGRQVLRSSVDNEEILRVLVIAGVLYSLPMLFEIRMSPQLHRWFYGYHSSDFVQAARDGGFRPIVFMGHGLLAAFFVMTTAVAAAALWRTETRMARVSSSWITAYLSGLLVLCKSLGALMYGVALLLFVRLTKPRTQMRIALGLVLIALSYPVLRIADLVPTSPIIETAALISADRAGSLETRFDQEQQLLDRASHRLVFGWGRWGRSRLYDEYGKDVTLSDGRWIITVGQFGLFGFVAEFGLLALSVCSAAFALRRAVTMREKIFLAALALIVAVSIIDLLPNSGLTPWTWLLAGALLGRAEALRVTKREWAKSELYSKAEPA